MKPEEISIQFAEVTAELEKLRIKSLNLSLPPELLVRYGLLHYHLRAAWNEARTLAGEKE
jgi:hypothetical protein